MARGVVVFAMTAPMVVRIQRPTALALALATLGLASCSCHGAGTRYIVTEAPRPAALATPAVLAAAAADTIVEARFRGVHLQLWPGVQLQLDELRGRLNSRRADHVVSFDDKRSFVLAVDSGTVGLATDDLGRLMNTYVFAYRGAPLRDLEFTVSGGHLVQKGIMHKVVDIPFEMVGEVSVTPAGEIRVHPLSMKICTIPGKGLMAALGITLAKMLDLRHAHGVRAEGNDLLLDPAHLLPPPAIAGHVVAVSVAPGRLVQYFGHGGSIAPRAAPPLEPDSATAHYMMFRGGTLEFGKLFMVHSDMQVIPLTNSAPFDFDIDRYHEQLVAGYHRTRPDDGLLVLLGSVSRR